MAKWNEKLDLRSPDVQLTHQISPASVIHKENKKFSINSEMKPKA